MRNDFYETQSEDFNVDVQCIMLHDFQARVSQFISFERKSSHFLKYGSKKKSNKNIILLIVTVCLLIVIFNIQYLKVFSNAIVLLQIDSWVYTTVTWDMVWDGCYENGRSIRWEHPSHYASEHLDTIPSLVPIPLMTAINAELSEISEGSQTQKEMTKM